MTQPITQQIRAERRVAAEARQDRYDAMSFEQKLQGAGAKERKKLEARKLAAEQAATKAKEAKEAKAKKAK